MRVCGALASQNTMPRPSGIPMRCHPAVHGTRVIPRRAVAAMSATAAITSAGTVSCAKGSPRTSTPRTQGTIHDPPG